MLRRINVAAREVLNPQIHCSRFVTDPPVAPTFEWALFFRDLVAMPPPLDRYNLAPARKHGAGIYLVQEA